MMTHVEIITLIIAYTSAGVFVATAIITILSMLSLIKLEQSTKSKLFNVLIVEIAAIAVGVFAGFLNFNPSTITEKITSLELVEKSASIAIENDPIAALKPRVYFHISDESQREETNRVVNSIIGDGAIIVPGIHNTKTGPNTTQLRYFRESEKLIAKEIGVKLEAAGLKADIVYIEGYEDSTAIRDFHFELWRSK